MKVILYSRTSTKSQNINEQLLSLVKVCDDFGWEILKTFKDESISGTVLEREGLTELINFCETEKVDKVVVSEISRLSRDKEQLKELISTLSNSGVSIYFHDLKIETLKDGKIHHNFLNVIYSEIDFSNREISKIRSRIERGYNFYRESGGKVGRKVGFRNTDSEILLRHEDIVTYLMSGVPTRSIMLLTGKSSGTVQKVRKILKKNNSLVDIKPMSTSEVLKKILEDPYLNKTELFNKLKK